MATKVGFIGVGDMGEGMALNLLKKGFDVTVVGHVRLEVVNKMVAMGAKKADSARELAAASQVIFSVVRDDAQTEEVMWGPRGVLEGIGNGSAIIISSTISPAMCRRLAKEAAAKGAGVLDAPVSGFRPASMAGTLTMMIGGDEDLVKRMEPVLSAVSARRFHLGAVGMGQVGKLANNMLAIVNILAVTEALSFAVQAGIPAETFLSFVNVSSGRSWMTENWSLVDRMKSDKSPNATLKMGSKDLGLALAAAAEAGADVPLMSSLQHLDWWRQVPKK